MPDLDGRNITVLTHGKLGCHLCNRISFSESWKGQYRVLLQGLAQCFSNQLIGLSLRGQQAEVLVSPCYWSYLENNKSICIIYLKESVIQNTKSFESDLLYESLDLVHMTGPNDSEQALEFK